MMMMMIMMINTYKKKGMSCWSVYLSYWRKVWQTPFPRIWSRVNMWRFAFLLEKSTVCIIRVFLTQRLKVNCCRANWVAGDFVYVDWKLSSHLKPEGWLEVGNLKVLRPAISTQVFLGFPVYYSRCWDGSRYCQVATTCFTCSPPYPNF